MAAIQIQQLRSSIRGVVIQPGDEAYESARKVRCVDVADVIAAVDGRLSIIAL
jgi:hypothetical protein